MTDERLSARRERRLWRDPRAAVAALFLLWCSAPVWRGTASLFVSSSAQVAPMAEGASLDALEKTHAHVSLGELADVEYREPLSRQRPIQLPSQIARLNGQPVSIDGFTLPTQLEGPGVATFLLNGSRDMCMFGAPSRAEQRVEVTMEPGLLAPLTHVALRVFGVLEIRPEYETGQLVGLYRMRASAWSPPGLGY